LLVLVGERTGTGRFGQVQLAELLVPHVDRHPQPVPGTGPGGAGRVRCADAGEAGRVRVGRGQGGAGGARRFGGAVHDVPQGAAQFQVGADAEDGVEEAGQP
jgi:hypothetical protein